MQNEHYLDYKGLTAEKISGHFAKHKKVKEFTCLLPKDDQSASSMLKENGFRYTGKRLVDGKVMIVFKWFRGLDKGPEDMRSFFNRRVRDYDLHMSDGNDAHDSTFISLIKDIPETDQRIDILDLGCGTGTELKYIFDKSPNAHIVCMDMAEEMLAKLRQDYRAYESSIRTVCSSYLRVDLGMQTYDFVVACNTLHHILAEAKLKLYTSINKALKNDGYLLISDYAADTPEEEQTLRAEYMKLANSGVINRNAIYHIDMPLTVEHDVTLLKEAGFTITMAERTVGPGVIITARA